MFDFFNWNKKESPLLGLQGLGGGLGYLAGGGVELFSATGGTNTFTSGGYTYHVFTSPGNLTTVGPSDNANSDITLMLIAGGGGGVNAGGGGGGGGVLVLTGTSANLDEGVYDISIGNGGPVGGNGTPSTIDLSGGSNMFTAVGGGGGKSGNTVGAPGGSGGGGGSGAYLQPPKAGGTGTSLQGNPGGSGKNDSPLPTSSFGNLGGGGGGGGGTGGNANITYPANPGPVSWGYYLGNGGAGKYVSQFPSSILTGNVPSIPSLSLTEISNGYYGGGGGGGGTTPNSGSSYFYNGNGGSGGGGNASRMQGLNGPGLSSQSGFTNTGGGGGGGNPASARTGGSGVFMIRYITP